MASSEDRVPIFELRVSVVDGAVHAMWRHAPQYPVRFGEQLAWDVVAEASGTAADVRHVVTEFLDAILAARETHHRVVVPLADRDDPRMNALARDMPELAAILEDKGEVQRPAPVLVLQASKIRSAKRPAALRLPLGIGVIGNDELARERTLEELGYVRQNAGIEENILHLGPDFDRRWLRDLLDSRPDPPRLVVLERFRSNDMSVPLVGTLLAAGCPAIAVFESANPVDRQIKVEIFYWQLLSNNMPLDRAVASARSMVARHDDGLDRAFLVAVDGAESMRLLSQSVMDVRDQFLDASAGVARRMPQREDELTRFVAQRLQRPQEELDELAYEADRLDFLAFNARRPRSSNIRDSHTTPFEEIRRLRDRARQVLGDWRDILAAFDDDGARELIPSSYDGFLPDDEPEDSLALPPRLTHVWLTEPDQEQHIPDQLPLTPGARYQLKVQLGFERAGQAALGRFPIEKLAQAFAEEDTVALDVLAFALPAEIELAQDRAVLLLPRFGESHVAIFPFTLRDAAPAATHRRVRIGIYHRNRLLQSVAVDLGIAAGQATTYQLDFLASDELLVADELPAVRASFFVNEGPAGTHWIGIAGLSRPAVLDLDPLQLHQRVQTLRARYNRAQGVEDHLYGPAIDPDSDNWTQRAHELVELARLGRQLYFDFLVAQGSLDGEQKDELETILRTPGGLIQIARCRDSAPGLPWGAFYDYELDDQDLSLCSVFEQDLRLNLASPGQRHDLLEDPARCAARNDCPLTQEHAWKTVCPFGFWGIRQRIEQPTHAVAPPEPATHQLGPPTLPRATWSTRDRAHGNASVAVACWQFGNTDAHLGKLAELARQQGGEVGRARTEAEVRALLHTEQATVIYFYCHGDELHGSFALKVGDAATAFKLAANKLHQWKPRWSQAPLVVLNGCETLAVSPDRVHGFLVVLRDRGASGVVGPEVPVWTSVARRVGEGLVGRFLHGEELGHALQAVQRELMRELNPIGLMYVAYAPAALRFVAPPLQGKTTG